MLNDKITCLFSLDGLGSQVAYVCRSWIKQMPVCTDFLYLVARLSSDLLKSCRSWDINRLVTSCYDGVMWILVQVINLECEGMFSFMQYNLEECLGWLYVSKLNLPASHSWESRLYHAMPKGAPWEAISSGLNDDLKGSILVKFEINLTKLIKRW